MARNIIISFLKLTTVLSLLLIPLVLTEDMDDEDDDIYVLDHFPSSSSSSSSSSLQTGTRSRFLTRIIKKGMHCDAMMTGFNICNGVSASKGRGLLFCCKKHCRNVLGDKNNCGRCGHKCRQGQRCCDGACTDVLFNENHCGKCGSKCSPGLPCDKGCYGYA
ncbi:protein GRIM REAPER-like [Prosopis cineraria]|uniref:protein GRIM REAPER-like n=1 Tax=Prosopis cineraria TaxID=364024 RepID=UPI0024108167|nr:protein GRIM REAPER-like [Prosopis cineraria]